jgi:uncharacterized damage-inducible protein DinB
LKPSDLRECFDYLVDSRERFLVTFRQLGWEEFSRDRGVSWGSMLGVLLHVLDDEEGWLQVVARGRPIADAPDRQPNAYSGFDDLDADNSAVSAATRAFFRTLTEEDLARTLEIPHGSATDRRSVERVIMHAFIDELAHLGELIGLLWQLDIPPPYIDWLDYRERHTHQP